MKNKLNIVFILTDDQGAWAIGCAGKSEVKTPNIDRLAKTGLLFENFFCTSPVCSPARASILTGKLPSQHGVHDWIRCGNIEVSDLPDSMKAFLPYENESTAIGYLDNYECYTDVLNRNGYRCGFCGKWHLGDSRTPQKGFADWFTIGRGGCSYYEADIIEEDKIELCDEYITTKIADKAVDFIENRKGEENPFYLSVHFTAPHAPWGREEHPKEYFDLYDDCEFLCTPDLQVHPWQVNTCESGVGERRKELLKGYYAAITAMDHEVGRIIDKIEQCGLREDTLVIFTSDNGMNMGHHGIWGKGNGTFPQNMYDTCVKVPFIASLPGKIDENRIYEGLTSHYDIFPTLIDYLQLPYNISADFPGKSFAGVLGSDYSEFRENVVIYDEYGPVRMIRTKEYKYVHRYPDGPHEFYDLINDPDESMDLIDDKNFEELIDSCRKKLTEWFIQYVNPDLDGTKEAVMGRGQLNLAGGFAKGHNSFATDLKYSGRKGRV
ncbi:sulfatase-like hydrolase/transferase [Clostridium grantii]|uniref:Arylsulfatase A n=1 Tax=Clostridium grantii DSM 8605 TaxID=1121316 RepID=A0A1M5SVF2_9CLOT|nr:sulfatase-like hydrolase/transferase [Clostridium grantii]SHH42522.1 Arylsulfatase A [Clostridium grantii DSM 8605]